MGSGRTLRARMSVPSGMPCLPLKEVSRLLYVAAGTASCAGGVVSSTYVVVSSSTSPSTGSAR